MTEAVKQKVRLIVGWAFLFLGLYTFLSFISYLFTWTADQSLLSDDSLFSGLSQVRNSGGGVGLSWANALIGRLFGLGAFIVPLFFLAVSFYCFRIKNVPIVKLFFMSAFGCILFSLVCGFVFRFTSWQYLFGAGAGGSYGTSVINWLVAMLGLWGTGMVLLLAIIIWTLPLYLKLQGRFEAFLARREAQREARREAKRAAQQAREEAARLAAEEAAASPEDNAPSEDHVLEGVKDATPLFEVITTEKPQEEAALPLERLEDQTLPTFTPAALDPSAERDDNVIPVYDPHLDLPHYRLPDLSLLKDYKEGMYEVSNEELLRNNQKIVDTLSVYKIPIEKISALPGPTVTLYRIVPMPGIRISQIKRLEDDIALSLAARGVRIIAPIPGTNTVGIEVANDKPSMVPMKAVLESPKFRDSKFDLPIVLGKTISNEVYAFDLAKMPHLLVAGATGQGKSVGLNAIITSLLYKMHPAYLKLVLVDPKKVELSLYSKLEKHFLAALPESDEPIITDTKKVVHTLKSLCLEMDARYNLLKAANVRNIAEYNRKFLDRQLNPQNGHRFMPFIVVIIDEFSDLILTAGREVEEPLTRLAQLARAIGIHLVIATQRPTTNIITGTIKANFPARIAFRVISNIDSRTILDMPGANQLIGRGDMLVSTGSDLIRVQCAFIDTPEVERVAHFISEQPGYAGVFELPEYDDSENGKAKDRLPETRDELFEEAARMVVAAQYGSTSLLQRKMNLGYNRAGRIMDQLEDAGIVGPTDGSKPRKVLISSYDSLDALLGTHD